MIQHRTVQEQIWIVLYQYRSTHLWAAILPTQHVRITSRASSLMRHFKHVYRYPYCYKTRCHFFKLFDRNHYYKRLSVIHVQQHHRHVRHICKRWLEILYRQETVKVIIKGKIQLSCKHYLDWGHMRPSTRQHVSRTPQIRRIVSWKLWSPTTQMICIHITQQSASLCLHQPSQAAKNV